MSGGPGVAKLRVLLVDDHALVRAGLQRLLEAESDLTVVAHASDGREALIRAATLDCDVVLLDFCMPPPSGTELVSLLCQLRPKVPILVLTLLNDAKVARAALLAGARGYVTKDSDPQQLLAALRAVCRGQRFIDQQLLTPQLMQHGGSDRPPLATLSRRELQVLRLLAMGHGSGDIGAALFISERTVSTHKRNLMAKLGLHSVADLVGDADECGPADGSGDLPNSPRNR